MSSYEWLLQGKDFDSIHPSLQRQVILNINYGLYEVIPGIYQVRGFDSANISFVKGKTGWIVFDPLTAKAALDFINEKLGERPVVAVVYSHSHADHFGGVRGVVDEMGGAQKIIAKGRELYDQGKYRLAQEILNKLVYAKPQNQEAKDLLADVFEQIGYHQQQEIPACAIASWRRPWS